MGNIGNPARAELLHSRNHEEPKYIALSDLNFAWLEEEILEALRLWDANVPLSKAADLLKRPWPELVILYSDLAWKGALTGRKGGLFGRIEGRK